ncbi:MAG: flagellin hook IN motif-containing protein [Aureliella sp.]
MTTFYPTVTSRASNQLGISRLLFQIHNDQSAIQELQTQLSTGRRISRPSEDPSAAIRALAAQRSNEFKSQVSDNLQSADTILSATESTLSQAQSILTEMRGVAIGATGTTLSEEEIDAFSQQIQSGLDQLLSLSNKKFRDQFIFSGSNVRESPLQYVDNTVQFSANSEELHTITDHSATVAANVLANDAFGVISDDVIGSADLNPALTGDTPLANLNRGIGIRNSAIRLSDGVEVVELDLSTAFNVSDVVEKIEQVSLSGRDLSVTIGADGLNIRYDDSLGGLLRISEVGSGSMANDLQINNTNSVGQSPVIGGDLDPIATEDTRLSDLFGGVGIADPDSFQITQGDKQYIITTANLETVEDLMNRIRQSGAQVQMSLDDTGRFFAIQSTESGTTLSIGENGSSLATQLGIRTFDLDTSVDSLNFGQGLSLNELGEDLLISRVNGSRLRVNLDGAQTVSDVLDRINNHVDNQVPTLRITASLASVGNGITLSAANGAQPISVTNVGGSQAGWGLGLIPIGESTVEGVPTGTTSEITGRDVSGVEVEGAFNSLIRLREAVESGRPEDMVRLAAAIEDDIQRMSLSRGFVGARQQSVEALEELTAEQQIQLTEAESNELDADLAQVISELAAREAAMQASLQLMGRASQLSLFDYL